MNEIIRIYSVPNHIYRCGIELYRHSFGFKSTHLDFISFKANKVPKIFHLSLLIEQIERIFNVFQLNLYI